MKTKLTLILFLVCNSIFAQEAKIEFLPNLPYDKYELERTDKKDTITFYLSVASSKDKLPLVVYIQGSGMNSLFVESNGRINPNAGHMTWFDLSQEKSRILIIEKPGVNYLQTGPSDSFDAQFSLENWSETIVDAINYILEHEEIDLEKVLVAGHSEGGVVAARVANLMKEKVSNAAILAGEGPSQLYSLYKFAEDGTFFNTPEHNMPTAEQRINYVTDMWNDILSDPTSTEKKFWGFTYLRWSSLLKTSVIDELSNYNGKILIVQGTNDKAVHPESAIVAYTSLLTKGKNVTLTLVENADHSFNISGQKEVDGWEMIIENTLKWFITPL